MAALTAGQNFVRIWDDGIADRAVLYAMRNVDTGDTADLSAEFSVVKRGVIVGQTVAGAASVSVTPPATVTMPAGMSDDAALMLVYGVFK